MLSPKKKGSIIRQYHMVFFAFRSFGSTVTRDEARNLKSLFDGEWPFVIAEQNKAKRKRRGGIRPKVERRLQPALLEVAQWGNIAEREKKRSGELDTISLGKPYIGCCERVHRLSAACPDAQNRG